jgi:hypothetical protein
MATSDEELSVAGTRKFSDPGKDIFIDFHAKLAVPGK